MPAQRSRPPATRAVAVVLALAPIALTSCGSEDDNALAPFSPVDVPDIRGPGDLDDAYSGVLDERVREDLDAYAGIEMTLLVQVADVLGPGAFTVTSPEGDGVEPVLAVTTPDAAIDPDAGDQLVLAATPVDEFDAEVVAEQMQLAVEAQELEEWDGQLFLVATIVEPASAP